MTKFSWSSAAIAISPFFYAHCSGASPQPKPATSTHSVASDMVEESSPDQMQLLEIINEPLPGGKQLNELRAKREAHTLTTDELDELIRIDDAREDLWARKLKAVADLAEYRGVEFDSLYRQLRLDLRVDAA